MYLYTYVCMHIYIYKENILLPVSLSLFKYVYTYIYIYMYMCAYIYIYIHTHTMKPLTPSSQHHATDISILYFSCKHAVFLYYARLFQYLLFKLAAFLSFRTLGTFKLVSSHRDINLTEKKKGRAQRGAENIYIYIYI